MTMSFKLCAVDLLDSLDVLRAVSLSICRPWVTVLCLCFPRYTRSHHPDHLLCLALCVQLLKAWHAQQEEIKNLKKKLASAEIKLRKFGESA